MENFHPLDIGYPLRLPGLGSEGHLLKNKTQKGFLEVVCPVILCPREPKERGAEVGREKEKGNNVNHEKERLVLSKGPGPGSTPTSARRLL